MGSSTRARLDGSNRAASCVCGDWQLSPCCYEERRAIEEYGLHGSGRKAHRNHNKKKRCQKRCRRGRKQNHNEPHGDQSTAENRMELRTGAWNLQEVAEAGLEPARAQCSQDFKS